MSGAPDAPREAAHFDGRTPERRAATVRVEPGRLTVETEGGARRSWPLDQVRLVRADANAVQLELLGDPIEALIVTDLDFPKVLREANGGRAVRSLGGGVPAGRLVLGFALLAAVLLFSAWRWGIPALANVAADRVPPEWERRFGERMVEGMVPPADRVTDPDVVDPVTSVFHRLLVAQGAGRDSFQLIVARDADVNAFAAPGGYVVITTSLLGSLRDFEELAAVLAHEITHVTSRHTTRGTLARLGVRALFSLIGGNDSGIGSAMRLAGTLGELSYSRRDENEADEGAVRLLAKTGIDPDAMERALDSISRDERRRGEPVAFLSTHPSTEGRRARAKVLAAQNPVQGSGILPPKSDWERMQEALRTLPARMGLSSP